MEGRKLSGVLSFVESFSICFSSTLHIPSLFTDNFMWRLGT